jgi:ribokinase
MRQVAKYDVVVVGGINTDYLIFGETLPGRSQTLEGQVFQQGPGGKGANQAVAAARLGARVAIVGRVGHGLRGEAMIEALLEEGIDTQHIMRDEHAETGAAVIMVERSGEKQILTAPGANLNVTIYDVLKAEPAIRRARVLLTQLEVPAAVVTEALRIARANEVRTVLDPSPPREFDRSILKNVDLIKPNAHEAEVLTGIKVEDRASAQSAARRLIAEGARAVAIQAGNEGNLLVWTDGEHWLPRIRVETIDATGAGDAFAGTISFGLAQGKSLVEAGKLANAAAALATTKLGAQISLPTAPELQSILAKIAA